MLEKQLFALLQRATTVANCRFSCFASTTGWNLCLGTRCAPALRDCGPGTNGISQVHCRSLHVFAGSDAGITSHSSISWNGSYRKRTTLAERFWTGSKAIYLCAG